AVTVWLAGDSTAASRVGSLYVGWGSELQRYLTVHVQNMAMAGKSLRSFTTDGHFDLMHGLVEKGDIVIIEFGHFEGGGPIGSIRNNVLCPGLDPTVTCESDDGEVFHTFFKYMEDAATRFKAAGAQVIISSQTPPNPFRGHSGTTPVYALYAKAVAEKTGVIFVDHFSLARDEYLDLGATAVNEMLPSDGIHTTLAGAEVVARSFVRGVLC
ncbi:rhamnogalacturonan acetyl esterase RgaeA, partial [Thelephora ganbajun]